jgi:ribose transport system permease protein
MSRNNEISKVREPKFSSMVGFITQNTAWVFLVILCIILSIFLPTFATAKNILNILQQSSFLGIVATGLTFAILSGSFDLSVGTTMGLATVIVLKMQPRDAYSTFIAVLVAILVGLLIGMVNGFVVGKIGTSSVITTMGTMYVILGITLIYSKGRHVGVTDMYGWFSFLGTGNIGKFPVPIFIFLLTVIIFQCVLSLTAFGRYVYATGGNLQGSIFSGIDTGLVKLKAYMISSLLATISGIIMAARITTVMPTYAFGYEFDVLTAVMLGGASLFGGKGSIFATVGGVFLLGVISNSMTLIRFPFELQLTVKGFIMILVISINMFVQRKRG